MTITRNRPVSARTKIARQAALRQLDEGKTPEQARAFLRAAFHPPIMARDAVAWAVKERARR